MCFERPMLHCAAVQFLHERMTKTIHARSHGLRVQAEFAGAAKVAAKAMARSRVLLNLQDFLQSVQSLSAQSRRDFPSFAQLAERIAPDMAEAPKEDLLRVASTFSNLGVLNPPLFASIGQGLLRSSDQGFSTQAAEVARVFAAQRFRHEEVFGRIAEDLRRGGVEALSPEQALSLLHSHASLRLAPPHGELDEEMWQALEKHVMSKGSPEAALKLCHVMFLAKRDAEGLPQVIELLKGAAPKLQPRPGLTRRILLLRSALRYLHRETYVELPKDVQQLFRKAHRMERPVEEPKHMVLFVQKLSHALTKLKIGHIAMAERGPFTFDIVERDRKIIYECNHFDRYYAYSTEKIAQMCLQERIVKSMGYHVVQVPHWHWNRIKHRRQRIEYIRMSRYYALKDRRELSPRDDQAQDVAVNELDFLGEYFFRKDQPQTHWAWFQPRYDASKRLPQTGTL